MSEQEALQTIAAIAEWVEAETPVDRAECGEVVRRLSVLTESADFEAMDDRTATAMFDQVARLLAGTTARTGA